MLAHAPADYRHLTKIIIIVRVFLESSTRPRVIWNLRYACARVSVGKIVVIYFVIFVVFFFGT